MDILFDRKRQKEAIAILRSDAPYEDRIKDLFSEAFQEVPALLIFDDFEQNLERKGEGFWLKRGAAEVLQPFLEALPWANGKTQLIITSRYPFSLETKGIEWVSTSLERISLMALYGADLRKKKRNLANLATSPHHEVYLRFSGGNPRLLEWFETLAQQGAVPDVAKLETDLREKSEMFIQQYLAEILVSAQEPHFQTFLAKAAVFRTPVTSDALSAFGPPEMLTQGVNLTLMEKEGDQDPVYWVMPLIRDQLWAKVSKPEAVHKLAYDWYNKKVERAEHFVYTDLDACVYHGALGFKMEGCWTHAVRLTNYFHANALYREGASRFSPLTDYLPSELETDVDQHVVAFLNNLGQLLQATNRLAEAEALMKRALAIDEASLGPDHPDVAIRLNNLGQLLQATNRLAEAEALMKRALAIDEASLGPDHPRVAIDLNNLGLLLQATNRLAEAEPLMKRALAIDEASLGPDHPRVAIDLNNLALLLQVTNRLAEAEPLMKRALAIDEASLGPDHPKVAIRLNNLAQLLKATNRLAEAEPLMRRALAIDEASLGPDHPGVARDLNNLALLLKATNRLAEAEPLMKRALAIDEASLGPDHPDVARDLNNLAQLLQATNRLAEAEPLMRRVLAIDEASLGPDHPDVARDLNNLGQLLQATNRLAEAEPLMKRALAINEASLGPDHPRVATDLNNLGQLLQATNRLAEAEPLMKRALAIDEASLGPDHPKVAIRLNNLGQLLQATNRLGEAEPLMKRALAIFEESLPSDHPYTQTVKANLEILLKEMKQEL